MKAYAILDGGGVKGAALVGCLHAAEHQGIEFVGYGGTSAGAMVALLSSVGYTPRDLKRMIVDEGGFQQFLDDETGERLMRFQKLGHRVRKLLDAHFTGKKKLFALLRAGRELKRLKIEFAPDVDKLRVHLGIYHGSRIRDYLLEKIRAKIDIDDHATDVTFADLSERPMRDQKEKQAKPLKIVASDITNKRPVVFPDDTGKQASVLDAVRASISYPFVFRPVRHGSVLYLDGGICSNLPVFLFEDERLMQRVAVIAMDLINKPTGRPSTSLVSVATDLLGTAIDGSDRLLRDRIPDLHHVPVIIDPPVDPMDFAISKERRNRLYSNGKDAYNDYHSKYLAPITRIRDRIQRLRTTYGSPGFFLPILDVVSTMIELHTTAHDVRCHIMLPTGADTLIVAYQRGMDGMSDMELEIPISAWGAGSAFRDKKLKLVDIERLRTEGVPGEQWHLVPDAIRSAVSYPILDTSQIRPTAEGAPIPLSDLAAIGVLTIDSTSPIGDTGWQDEREGKRTVPVELFRFLEEWSNVLGRLLS